MSMYLTQLADVVRRDPRYPFEAYEFLYAALNYTQRMLGRVPREGEAGEPGPECHVSGPELLEGVRRLALREFGLMARTVFRLWGINRTDDFGELVFNLVGENLMSKTESDCREDFHDLYDLDEALVQGFRIELDEVEWKA
jgi:uncharacterized repeat protein (TIGR04138 family)